MASVVFADGSAVGAEFNVEHGRDGWVLVEMDWNPDSGVAVYDYVKTDEKGRFVASACAMVSQPCHEKHYEWKQLWNEPRHVFNL